MKILSLFFVLGLFLQSVSTYADFAPASAFFGERTTSDIDISPKGDKLFVGGYIDDKYTFIVANMKLGNRKIAYQSKRFEKVSVVESLWLNNKTVFLSLVRYASRPVYERFLIEISDSSDMELKRSDVHSNASIIDSLPEQENSILVQIDGRSNREKVELHKVSIDQLIKNKLSSKTKLRKALKNSRRYYTDAKHDLRFSYQYDEDTTLSSYWYLDAKNKWKKFYQYDYRDHRFYPIDFLANGKLAVISNKNTDKMSLYEFDVASGEYGEVLFQHAYYDIHSAEFSKHKLSVRSVAYYANGDFTREYFFDEDRDQQRQLLRAFPSKGVNILSASIDNKFSILEVFSPSAPTEYYYYDVDNLNAQKLSSAMSKLDNTKLARVESILTSVGANISIESFLTSPNNSNGVLLVMPHGGPIGVQDVKRFNPEVQYLANRGYSVLQVNFRGSAGYGKSFRNQGRAQFGKRIESDINKVLDDVLTRHEFEHICSIGASYGGYSAVMLAISQPEKIQCVIARFGIYDLPLIFNGRNTAISATHAKHWSHVVGKESPEQLLYSPVYFPEKIKAPVLITAGQKDRQAVFEHSNRMRLALELSGRPPEYLFYKRSAHGHQDIFSRTHELVYIDDFIRRTLKLPLLSSAKDEALLHAELRLLAEGFEDGITLPKNKKMASDLMQRADKWEIRN